MKRIILTCLALLFLSFGCASTPESQAVVNRGKAVKELVPNRFGEETLARELNKNLRYPEFKKYPVIVTTFVDLNDLEKTSVFGRVMAEKLLHHMNQEGFHVVEVRRAQDLFIKKEVGEMILTRNTSELAKATKAKSVLVGTYVATTNALIINGRLVDIKTPRILSTFSYEVPITDEIESLLSGETPF